MCRSNSRSQSDHRAELHHDLDEFLEDAEDDDEGEADEYRLAQLFGGQRQRDAQHRQQRRPDD